LKIKSFSWLNPSGPVFDIPDLFPQPPSPFEYEGKDFVPLTKSFGIRSTNLISSRNVKLIGAVEHQIEEPERGKSESRVFCFYSLNSLLL